MSGPYRDTTGPGSVVLTQAAAAEFGNHGFNVEVLSADHQNKPDVGANIARQWYDQGVDVILDVADLLGGACGKPDRTGEEQGLPQFGAATSDSTGAQVQPEHGALDLRHLDAGQRAPARRSCAHRRRTPGSFFTPTTPSAMRWNATPAISSAPPAGGWSARCATPSATTDFSAFVVQAQAPRAKVLGMANASTDTRSTPSRAAREFGPAPEHEFAALLMGVMDTTRWARIPPRGMLLTESFYWDLKSTAPGAHPRVRRGPIRTGPPAMVRPAATAPRCTLPQGRPPVWARRPPRPMAAPRWPA